MRVIFVARHDAGGNCDEDAITHSLTVLGHDVQRIHESVGHKAIQLKSGADLLLWMKWHDPNTLAKFKGICPRAFFYPDLVRYPSDPTIAKRCDARKRWMADILPHVEVGFCTDGMWVEEYNGRCFEGTKEGHQDKLVWLTQGADERVVGLGEPLPDGDRPILFTGISQGGGQGRVSFVNEMRASYGAYFHHVAKGVYGEDLKRLIASSRLVVAPDSPFAERYASNRIYVSAGFGACLLHPWSPHLQKQYGESVLWYRNREELHALIARYMNDAPARKLFSDEALRVTIEKNLYRHRLETLIKTVQGLKK